MKNENEKKLREKKTNSVLTFIIQLIEFAEQQLMIHDD